MPVRAAPDQHTREPLRQAPESEPRADEPGYRQFARRGKTGMVVAVGISAVNGYVWYQWQVAEHRASKGNYAVLDYMKDNFLCSRENYNQGRWWTLVTSGFSHMTGSHILFNTLGVISFLPVVAAQVGVVPCVVAYLASIVGGSAAHLYRSGEWQDKYLPKSSNNPFALFSTNTQKPDDPALGASAGVFGLFTISMICAPTVSVSIFFIPFPAWLAWGLLTGVDAYCTLSTEGREKMAKLTGVHMGHEAHLAGSATGALFTFLMIPRIWMRR